MSFDAVLFDFSDTLFWRNSAERLAVLLAERDIGFDDAALSRVWGEVKRESVTPNELLTRHDSSAEAHRRCWLDLLRPFDRFQFGAAEAIYLDQPNPAGWHPFEDTLEVLDTLSARGIPIGVVSDIGWDLRPVFEQFDADRFVKTWVLSYEHGTEKPDPYLFELGCQGLGSSPGRTLMVGDSVEKDGGAARAGLTALPSRSTSGAVTVDCAARSSSSAVRAAREQGPELMPGGPFVARRRELRLRHFDLVVTISSFPGGGGG